MRDGNTGSITVPYNNTCVRGALNSPRERFLSGSQQQARGEQRGNGLLSSTFREPFRSRRKTSKVLGKWGAARIFRMRTRICCSPQETDQWLWQRWLKEIPASPHSTHSPASKTKRETVRIEESKMISGARRQWLKGRGVSISRAS